MGVKKKAVKNKAGDERKQEQWRKQGLALRVSQHQWDVAKWILRGENLFKSKKKAYDEAVKLTGMTRQTLQSFASTARNVKALTRVKELSFGHHRLVMKYTDEEQKELLKYALTEPRKSVDSFAAYLRNRDKDAARRGDSRTPADQAAHRVIQGCEELLRNYNFLTLLNDPPSSDVRAELLKRLKRAVAELNTKAEQMAAAWRNADDAEQAFQAENVPETKTLGASAR